MSYIQLRVLKCRRATNLNKRQTEISLMRPAFEPFLLARLFLKRESAGITSLQFRDRSDPKVYHYANIEHAKLGHLDETFFEVILAGDLRLDPNSEWNLVKIDPDGKEEFLGLFSYNFMRMWSFEGETGHSRETVSNSLHQLVFIGGAPKSGTNWVEKLLNVHSDILATGENGLFGWPDTDKLETIMGANPPRPYAYAAPKCAPYRTRAATAYAGQAERVLKQVADIAGVAVVADKTPEYGMYLPSILETLPEARYIHCVRDPLDAAVSRFFHERNVLRKSPDLCLLPLDNGLRSHVLNFNSTPSVLGDMFKIPKLLDWTLQECLEGHISFEISGYCERVHIVRYEDLVSDFVKTASELFSFCGVEVSSVFLEAAALQTNFSRLANGRMPGEADEQHFFRKGIVGDHLNYMTPSQINYSKAYILKQCPWYQQYFET